MAYNASYASTDIAPATIDVVVSIIAIFVPFATLIGIVLLWNFLKKRM